MGVIGEDLTCDLLAGEYDLQMTRRFKGYRTRTKKGMSDIAPSVSTSVGGTSVCVFVFVCLFVCLCLCVCVCEFAYV